MPAKTHLPPSISKIARIRTPLYILAIACVLGLAAWARSAWSASVPPATTSSMTPALRLAAGTINLEGTDQAIDSATAARLLPLWQLLDELDSSSATAPQEITAVIEEIRLNMTSAQIDAIDAMSISQAELGGVSGNAGSSTTAKVSGTQAASAASGPVLGGIMGAGGMPMDGGGPMPPSGSQSASTSRASASTARATVIQQVIQLLQTRVQG
jgi:hypothetical protein